jgi:hypothetical protein
VLIRPDQFVAWRGANADVAALIRKISGTEREQQNLDGIFGRVAS